MISELIFLAIGQSTCIKPDLHLTLLHKNRSTITIFIALHSWQALQLIVEKALSTTPVPLSLGYSFQRVLECVASGSLLPGNSLQYNRTVDNYRLF